MASKKILNQRVRICIFGVILKIIFIHLIHSVYSNNFELTNLRNGFFGSIIIDSTILVYGDYGTIFKSTDLGRKWRTEFIGRYERIYHIENFNDTLWGILENTSVIRSYDKGKTWEIFDINMPHKEHFYWILVDSNYLYIRCDSSLLKLDKSCNIEKIITDTLLKVTISNYQSNALIVSPISQPYPQKIYFVFDKLVIPIWGIWDSFCVLDKNFDNLNLVSIKDKIPKQEGENYLILYDIINFDKKYTFQFHPRYNLYTTDPTFSDWKLFFKDSSFLNYTFEDSLRRWKNYYRLMAGSFFTDFVSLYGVSKEMIVYNVPYSNGAYKPLYLKFFIKEYRSEPFDTFVVIGNYFKDIYLANEKYYYYGKVLGREIITASLSKPNVSISENLAVFTSNNPNSSITQTKFVLLSRNRFSDWELVNLVQGKPFYILNDSTFFFVNDIEIYRTFDAGNTFKPFESYIEGDTDIVIPGHFNIKEIRQMFVDTSGKGVLLGYPSNPFPTKTYNFFQNIEKKVSIPYYQSLRSSSYFSPSNISFVDNKFLFSFFDTSQVNFRYFIYVGDSSFRHFDQIVFDSMFAPMYISPHFVNEFIALGLGKNNDSISFEIRYTNDTGHTWRTQVRLDGFRQINQIYEHNRDSIFIVFNNPDKIFLYERKKNNLQQIWQNEESGLNPLLMVISDRFYIVGRGLFLENTDRSDLTQWRQGEWDYGK
ncbi:MAG: WD40/YVTN/BNR-like repeat-containing protein, partial [Candidatus Kapaibacteriota bacterium]